MDSSTWPLSSSSTIEVVEERQDLLRVDPRGEPDVGRARDPRSDRARGPRGCRPRAAARPCRGTDRPGGRASVCASITSRAGSGCTVQPRRAAASGAAVPSRGITPAGHAKAAGSAPSRVAASSSTTWCLPTDSPSGTSRRELHRERVRALDVVLGRGDRGAEVLARGGEQHGRLARTGQGDAIPDSVLGAGHEGTLPREPAIRNRCRPRIRA